MIQFYIIAGAVAVLAALVLAMPLVMRRRAAMGHDQADAQIFRDQLAEIDRDLERGTINQSEAEGAKIEISRRLLRADQRDRITSEIVPAPRGASMGLAIVTVLVVPMLAAGIYASIGSPDLPDLPLAERAPPAADRPGQVEAEALVAGQPSEFIPDPEYAALLEQLQAMIATRPDDPEGQRLLGITLMRIGRFVEARHAFDRHLEMAGQADADTHANHAETMILAAGGYVSPEAEIAVRRALEQDPENQMARYYAGIALRQMGRVGDAVQIWQRLRAEAPPDAPWLEALDAVLADATGRLPGATPGPSQEDIEAAQQMPPEDRAAMINQMVAGLEERLTTEGGEVEDWARLMGAYTQLGRQEDALRAYTLGVEAQLEPSAKSFLKEQALLMGLSVQ